MSHQPTVHIVDDDPQVRESLNLLLRSVGLETQVYESAEAFLDRYEDAPGLPRCLILDIRMPGMSGLGLQERLKAEGMELPTIVITAFGDVAMAVKAMESGAVDFIEKPFSRQALLTRVQEAIDQDARRRHERNAHLDVMRQFDSLSQREREVMELVIAGYHSKQIAARLAIGEKTVAKHRSRVFDKLQGDSIAALVHLAYRCGFAKTILEKATV